MSTSSRFADVGFLIQGCMGLGGNPGADAWSRKDVDRARVVIRAATDAGIAVFDHADIYCRSKAESVFGEALAESPGLRDRIFIQTKCGIRPAGSLSWKGWNAPAGGEQPPYDPGRYDSSAEWILSAVAGSLRRLRCGWIDRLLLHRPDPLMQPAEVVKAFSFLKADGRVRSFGVSNFSASQMRWLESSLASEGITIEVDQIELSLLHHDVLEAGITVNQRAWAGDPWKGEFDSTAGSAMTPAGSGTGDIIPWCAEHKVELQAWGCLAQGRLTGRALAPDAPPAVRDAAALIQRIAKARGVSTEAVALAWLMRLPVPVHPVIGTTTPERIARCGQAVGVELSREEWYALYAAARGGNMP